MEAHPEWRTGQPGHESRIMRKEFHVNKQFRRRTKAKKQDRPDGIDHQVKKTVIPHRNNLVDKGEHLQERRILRERKEGDLRVRKSLS